MYHTQEKRRTDLDNPIHCDKDDAWLGDAFYFWYSEQDAIFWGLNFKRKTGKYQIYQSNIDCSNVLDTVFNEQHYLFWVRNIEAVAKKFMVKIGAQPTLKELNEFLKDKGIWTKFSGIMFQDISNNPQHYIVQDFQYKKRIQLAVYNLEIISNFTLHFEGEC